MVNFEIPVPNCTHAQNKVELVVQMHYRYCNQFMLHAEEGFQEIELLMDIWSLLKNSETVEVSSNE
jgi:hypothetical protein